MEILIIGGLFVLLMVFVSTKIKKNAAAAYEPETVEKEDFRIEKAEGFLYPLRDKPDFPFEAYSKLYGERRYHRNIWRARVRLRINDGLILQKMIKEIKDGEEKFISQKNFDNLPEGQKGTILRTETVEEVGEYKVLRKLVQSKSQGKTYELKTTMLIPHDEEYIHRACQMMESFEVK
jgi:hypothetical protein